MADEKIVEKLRIQRDRFIAFAFAGADLLLELGDNDIVTYAAGAGEPLYGVSEADLQGHSLADFIYPRDRQRFAEALERLHNTGRLDHTPLTLMGANGTVTRMRLSGIRLPQFPKSYHLALCRIPPIAVVDGDSHATGDADPKAKFVEMVRTRLNEANRIGQEYRLTMFDLSATDFGAVEPATAQSFLSTLQHTLDECSVRGASAASLSERTFGLVHDDKITAEAVEKRVHQLAAKFKGKVQGAVLMHSATLEMEDSALSDEDIAKALTYIVTNFVRDSARFGLKSLEEGARAAVEDTLLRVRNFRKLVKGGKLIFHFQPIVNLRTGAVLKYEAFGRIAHNGGVFVPQHIIPFATDVGMIGEFDLVACETALRMMKEASQISPLAHVSINVSGHSLGNPGFYRALLKMLEANQGLLNRLVIEITDAARIYNLDEARRLLSRLRKLGCRISLDDFGQGGSAFEILRVLPVDYAKLDADFVLNARDTRGRSVVKALTGLCHDLGIVTIGECVEDSEMVKLLRDVNVDYAQGYFFSPPAPDAAKKIKYFTEQVKLAGTAEPGLAVAG